MPRPKKRRKTKAERHQGFLDGASRAWDRFRKRLADIESFVEARKFVNEAPPVDSPGRRFYSNLGFFLNEFAFPSGASDEEKELYLQLIQKFDKAGELKPGVRQRLEKDFG